MYACSIYWDKQFKHVHLLISPGARALVLHGLASLCVVSHAGTEGPGDKKESSSKIGWVIPVLGIPGLIGWYLYDQVCCWNPAANASL
eukprot:scaffold48026_cov17-Tisochrysis_lutea.AAC.3